MASGVLSVHENLLEAFLEVQAFTEAQALLGRYDGALHFPMDSVLIKDSSNKFALLPVSICTYYLQAVVHSICIVYYIIIMYGYICKITVAAYSNITNVTSVQYYSCIM